MGIYNCGTLTLHSDALVMKLWCTNFELGGSRCFVVTCKDEIGKCIGCMSDALEFEPRCSRCLVVACKDEVAKCKLF